jgi:O-antigen/teichoic acid export membrane protein
MLARRVAVLIYGRAIAFGLSLAIPIALTRLLLKEEYGTYQQLVLVYVSIQALLLLGTPQSLQYFFPRMETAERPQLIRQTWGLLGLASLFIILIFWAAQGILEVWQPLHPLKQYLLLLGVYTGLMILAAPFQNLLVLEDRTVAAMWITIGFSLLDLVVLPLAAWLNPSAMGMVHGILVAATIKALIVLIYIFLRYLRHGVSGEAFMRKQLAYGIPVGLTALVYVINFNIDKYLVSLFFSTSIFAVYYIGSLWAPVFGWITFSASQVVTPRMSAAHKEGRLSEMERLYGESVRNLALVFLPFTVVLAVIAQPLIISLFTADYAAAVPVFMIYLLLLPSRPFSLGWVLMASGQTRFLFKLAVLMAITNAFLSYTLLVTLEGGMRLLGIPIATVTVTWLSTIFVTRQTAWTLKIPFARLCPWRAIGTTTLVSLLAGAPAASLWVLDDYYDIGLKNEMLLGSCLVVYSLVFLWLASRLGVLNIRDRKFLQILWPF